MSDSRESVANETRFQACWEAYEEVCQRLSVSSVERIEQAEVARRVSDFNLLQDMYLLLHKSQILKIRGKESKQ